MSAVNWSSAASGNWTTATDWSPAAPVAGDDVTIAVGGVTVTINSALPTLNSLTTSLSTLDMTNGGSLAITGNLNMGGAYVQSGGTLTGNGNGWIFSSTVSLSAGLLQLNGASGVFNGNVNVAGGTLALGVSGGIFNAGLIETAGVVSVKHGALVLQGQSSVNSIFGTVSGGGELVINGGSTTLGTTTGGVMTRAVVSVPVFEIEAGAVTLGANLSLSGLFTTSNLGTVLLAGHVLSLTGTDRLGNDFSGFGTVNANGSGQFNGMILDGSTLLTIGSSYNQTGNITIGNGSGSTAQMNISSGGTLRVTGNDTIFNPSASGTLNNAGLLDKTGGSGLAEIFASVASTGTITVARGTMDFSGVTNSFSGLMNGAGGVTFGGGTGAVLSDTFSSGFTLATASALIANNSFVSLNENLAYGGEFQMTGGTLLLNGSAVTLALSGADALDGGLIKGVGTLTTAGAVNFSGVDIEGFTHLSLNGTTTVTDPTLLGEQSGSGPVATVGAAGVFLLEDDAAIIGASGTLTNMGTIEKSIGSNFSTIQSVLNSSGNLIVATSTMVLDGSGSLGGTISGHGNLDLIGNYTLDAVLSVGELIIDSIGTQNSVTLGQNLAYANVYSQRGGTLQLGGNTLTLTGNVGFDGGAVSGPGTLTSAGATTLDGISIGQNAVVTLTGSVEQSADITLGSDANSRATLQIAKGAIYTLDATQNILGSGTLSVAGLLNASGSGLITAAVVDTGSIKISNGAMLFSGNVTGSGSVLVGAGGTLDFHAGVDSSTSISFSAAGGALYLEQPNAFGATLKGFVTGDFIELGQFDNNLANASLSVAVSGSTSTVTISDTIGHSIALHFASVQSTSTLLLADGPHLGLTLFHT